MPGKAPSFDNDGLSLEEIRAMREAKGEESKKIPFVNDDEKEDENEEKKDKKEEEDEEILENKEIDKEDEEEKKENENEKDEEEEKEKTQKKEDKEEEIDYTILQSLKQKAANYDVLMVDYTKKTQRLAEIERGGIKDNVEKQKTIPVFNDQELEKMAEENNWDIEATKAAAKLIDKILPAKGYVQKQTLEERDYSRTEDQQIKLFIEKYPDYKPENDTNNTRWTVLMNHFFDKYQKPKNPEYIFTRLKEAHFDLFPENKPKVSDNYAKAMVKIRKNKVAGMGGGSGGSGTENKSFSLTDRQVEKLRQGGWTDTDIKEYYS